MPTILPGPIETPVYLEYHILIDGREIEINPETMTHALRMSQGQIFYEAQSTSQQRYARELSEPQEELTFDIRLPQWSWSKITGVGPNQLYASYGLGLGPGESAASYKFNTGGTDNGTYSDNLDSIIEDAKSGNSYGVSSRLPGIGADREWINRLLYKAKNEIPVTITIQRHQGLAINPVDVVIPRVGARNIEEKKYVIDELTFSEDAKSSFWTVVHMVLLEYRETVRYRGKLKINPGADISNAFPMIGSGITYEDEIQSVSVSNTTSLVVGCSLHQAALSRLATAGASLLRYGMPSIGKAIAGFVPGPLARWFRSGRTATRTTPRVVGIGFDNTVHHMQLANVPYEDVRMPAGTEIPITGSMPEYRNDR